MHQGHLKKKSLREETHILGLTTKLKELSRLIMLNINLAKASEVALSLKCIYNI